MRKRRFIVAFLFLTLSFMAAGSSLSIAQQKKDEKKLPPINPAQAKLLQTFKGLDGPGLALASSINASIVAAACDRSTIQMWHKDTILGIRSGDNSANVFRGHTGPVLALAWNGGPVLASAGADKKIILWQVARGSILRKLETPFLVRALAMSSDGKRLASAGDATVVQLWDMESGKSTKQLKGHKDWIKCLAFSADGKQLVSGGYENNAILWNVDTGNKVRELPAPPKKKPKQEPDVIPITEVAFSPDGKQIALGRADGEIDMVNPANGQKIRTLKGHESRITGLIFHPSNKLLVSSSRDGTVRLWNPANGAAFKTLTGHNAWVEDVGFLAQGTMLASVGADRTVRVWSLTP